MTKCVHSNNAFKAFLYKFWKLCLQHWMYGCHKPSTQTHEPTGLYQWQALTMYQGSDLTAEPGPLKSLLYHSFHTIELKLCQYYVNANLYSSSSQHTLNVLLVNANNYVTKLQPIIELHKKNI